MRDMTSGRDVVPLQRAVPRVPELTLPTGQLTWNPLRRSIPAFLALGALLLWTWTLHGVDLSRLTDLGLVSVLPLGSLVALVTVLASLALSIRQRAWTPLLLFQMSVLIFMLYGVTTLVEPTLRIESTYKHIGITELIMRTGHVDPQIDAYLNWPGFFILTAFLTSAAGMPSAAGLAAWTPVFYNLLYLGPLLVLYRSATRDKRLIWLAVMLFYLGNWVGQDYFSPQGLAYFLALVILAILLRWFQTGPAQDKTNRATEPAGGIARLVRGVISRLPPSIRITTPSQPWQRFGLMAVVIAAFTYLVPTHQLTPFVIIAGVTALVGLNRIQARGMPWLMGIVAITWLVFMAVPFLSGHIDEMLRYVGQVTRTVNSNVGSRLNGSSDHLLVVYGRILMAAALAGLAVMGALRRLRAGRLDLSMGLLAAAPMTLILFQSYGGELVMRIYLFALPFLAFFAAALYLPAPRPLSRLQTGLILATSVVLLGGFLLTRYGNERMDYFTPDEVAGVQQFYAVAEPGAALVGGAWNFPWRSRGYETYTYFSVENSILKDDLPHIVQTMRSPSYPNAYLMLTRSQRAYLELLRGMEPGAWDHFVQELQASGQFRLVYSNPDVQMYVLTSRVPNP